MAGPEEVNSLIPRQLVENVQSVWGAVAAVAIDYPIGELREALLSRHRCLVEIIPYIGRIQSITFMTDNVVFVVSSFQLLYE